MFQVLFHHQLFHHYFVFLHLREYYMDFDEEWKPTPKGIAMELDFNNSRELFSGLVEIVSELSFD